MSDKPSFRSDLAQIPLPEVLVTIHRYKVPGVVECSRENETKKIFIDGGNIIFATSNAVADSLGDRLLASGRITTDQYRESVHQLLGQKGKRQGTILVEMGALGPRDVFVAVHDQVQSIVWSLFEWEQGSVSFVPGHDRSAEFIKLNIPAPQAVLEGVRRVRDAKRLIARMGSRQTVLQRASVAGENEITLTGEAEIRILDAVDGRKTLFELTNLPEGTPAQNARILYALFALRLISIKPSSQVKVKLKQG